MPFSGNRAECVCHTAWEGAECDSNVAASSSFFSHPLRWQVSGEFIYRYILRDSCSQFDSLPLTSLTQAGRRAPRVAECAACGSERCGASASRRARKRTASSSSATTTATRSEARQRSRSRAALWRAMRASSPSSFACGWTTTRSRSAPTRAVVLWNPSRASLSPRCRYSKRRGWRSATCAKCRAWTAPWRARERRTPPWPWRVGGNPRPSRPKSSLRCCRAATARAAYRCATYRRYARKHAHVSLCRVLLAVRSRLSLPPSLPSLPPSLPSRYPPQQIELALASPSLPLRSQGTWGPLIDPFDLLRVAEHRVTSYSIDEKGGQE